MHNNFTHEDLLRFFYNETSIEEKRSIERALKSDAHLKLDFEKLITSLDKLNEMTLEPSESSISIIMNFAKNQHPELQ